MTTTVRDNCNGALNRFAPLLFLLIRRQESGLQSVERALVPGGSFTQLVVSPTAEAAGAAARQLELTLGGFVDVSAAPAQPSASGSGVTVMISATTPNWNATAVPLLPRKAAAAKAAADLVTMTGVAGKGWVVASGAAGTAVDLIDENALLAGDDAVATSAAANSCTTKRRACANCSCGRAEAENAADTAVAPAPAAVSAAPVKSQCGNCFKGDAFRCATCPHLGKPAFKPGMDGALLLDTGASDF